VQIGSGGLGCLLSFKLLIFLIVTTVVFLVATWFFMSITVVSLRTYKPVSGLSFSLA
jgi:energy-coupling factor transporter transmembrane protein EcfT